MTTDLLPLLSDTDRDLHETATAAALVLDRVLGPRPGTHDDREVDLGGDGYDWDEAA
jgi:hypothetical protein